MLEWTRLSDITGNETYGKLAQKGESYLINPLNPAGGEPFPGLLGNLVSIKSGKIIGSEGGWTGGTDSYYEYLIKMYLYDPERFAEYKDRWVDAAKSSITYLASHPTSRPDLTFLAYYENSNWLEPKSEHREFSYFILCASTVSPRRWKRCRFVPQPHGTHLGYKLRTRPRAAVRKTNTFAFLPCTPRMPYRILKPQPLLTGSTAQPQN